MDPYTLFDFNPSLKALGSLNWCENVFSIDLCEFEKQFPNFKQCIWIPAHRWRERFWNLTLGACSAHTTPVQRISKHHTEGSYNRGGDWTDKVTRIWIMQRQERDCIYHPSILHSTAQNSLNWELCLVRGTARNLISWDTSMNTKPATKGLAACIVTHSTVSPVWVYVWWMT